MSNLFDKDEMAALRAQLADVLNSAQILEEMAERLTARIRGDLAEIGNPIRLAVGDRLLVTYECQDVIAENNPNAFVSAIAHDWPHMAEVTVRAIDLEAGNVTIQLRGRLAVRIPLEIARKMRGEWLLNAESDANGGTSND